MHEVLVASPSVRETGADELDKQLRVEENHDWFWQLETLRQTELMIIVCSLLLTVVDEKIVNVVVEEEENYRILWSSNLRQCVTCYHFLSLHSAP